MKYPTGHKISAEVFQSIRFVAKVGVMSRATWYELFGRGSIRWKQKQLQHLIEREIFKPHPCSYVQDVFAIGELGKRLVKENDWVHVPSISAQFIEHDEAVAKGIWRLEQRGVCKKWLTDKELKMLGGNSFKHNVNGTSDKFPDAVFRLSDQAGGKIVAIEYEKTVKNNWRYNKAIKAYSDSSNFNFILYLVESKGIENAVKRAMKFISDTSLNSKIGFIDVDDWRLNPETAPIRWRMDVTSLSDFMPKAA